MTKISTSYSEIWRIAWPVMLSSLANTVINFTDTAFVSRVGETELAAAALGGVLYFVMVMMGVAIGIGSQILIARKAGEDKPSEIGIVFDHSMIILLGLALLLQLLFYGLMPSFINMIINDENVAAACIKYLHARGWGLIFMMTLISFRSFYIGIAMTRIVTYTTVLMMLLNVFLNYVFVFGHFGVSPMGIFGVGLASAISESVAAVYAIIYTFSKKSLLQFNLLKFKNLNAKVYKEILNLSSPIVLQHFVSMGAWFLFFVMIEKLGAHELAVSNVVRSIYMVLMTPIWGYSQTTNSMVSNVIGQGRSDEVLPFVRKIMLMSFITGIICTSFCVMFPGLLFDLTTSDQLLIDNAMGSFYVVSSATVIFSLSMVLLSAVSGTGDTKAAMLIEMINIVIYILYVYVFTEIIKSSTEIVWGCEIIYWFLMGLLSFWYLKSGRWKKNIVKAEVISLA